MSESTKKLYKVRCDSPTAKGKYFYLPEKPGKCPRCGKKGILQRYGATRRNEKGKVETIVLYEVHCLNQSCYKSFRTPEEAIAQWNRREWVKT